MWIVFPDILAIRKCSVEEAMFLVGTFINHDRRVQDDLVRLGSIWEPIACLPDNSKQFEFIVKCPRFLSDFTSRNLTAQIS